MYTTKGYVDTLVMWLSLIPIATNGHMGMIMDENNPKM
jgi:hypothetical protein